MRIVVVGAGAMGRWTVKALGLDPGVTEIVVADVDQARAAEVAASMGGAKARAVSVDAREPESLRRALAGAAAVVNAAQHTFNIGVMHAAAAARVHYTDLGGLFHVTREQVGLDAEFRDAGVTAVISMGGAPGVTNLLARYAVDRLDSVEAVEAVCGNLDATDWSGYEGWVPPYSLETLCDEFSVPAPQFIDGEWRMDIPGGADAGLVDFGPPAGRLRAHYTIHSEPFTFWHAWKDRGLASATWKLALPEAFTAQMRFLARLGLTSTASVPTPSGPVRPRDVLLAAVAALPKPVGITAADVDYLLAIVRGRKDRRSIEWRVRASVPAHAGLGASGGELDTGVPPAIVATMLARGDIAGPGVFVPEQIVPTGPFFEAFAAWGATIDAEMREVLATGAADGLPSTAPG